ncbi:SdpI family protein [Staphylococcus debuckii]|uniref:SdpI family protein n=1 Tax=Staphylococcus debuckii TaxID=2044912 RepID=A0ABU9EV49_9STAP
MLLFGITLLATIIHYLFFRSTSNNVTDQRNLLMGYRTPSSLKSSEAWAFAQTAFRKNFKRVHFVLLVLGLIWTLYDLMTFIQQTSLLLQTLVYFAGVVAIIILTEIQLHYFNPKQKGGRT